MIIRPAVGSVGKDDLVCMGQLAGNVGYIRSYGAREKDDKVNEGERKKRDSYSDRY